MAFNKARALQEAEKSLAQGKTSQAIKLYLDIYAKDPTDPTLLNTVGDLYLREKNLPEALKHFHKLAESYTQEGFTIKAIAIYKKISRLDANNVDVLLKTGELYMVQGLGREAREQFTQAVEFLRKKNQNDRAVEVYRKIVSLDPDNPTYRARFADFCEQTGRKSDAAGAYRESAEIAFRRGDLAGAEAALAKAASLAPQDSRTLILRARLALAKNQPVDAEKILTSSSAVKSDPAAQKLLLESYLGTKRLDEAKALVGEVFRRTPSEFTPLESFARLCLEKAEYDTAVASLADASDALIQQKATGRMIAILREIWEREPRHLPTLELIYKIAEKTADEATLPEVLQALGDAYAGAGNLDRAEWAFRKLVDREPENEDYKALLRGLLQKAGKEVPVLAKSVELAGGNIALTADTEVGAAEATPSAPAVSEEEAAMVKEALENSDLFSRYNLADKAVAELEKVLTAYPEQIEIHRRILEVSQKSLPERAKQSAEALAVIFAKRGDLVTARRYEAQSGKELHLEKVTAEVQPLVSAPTEVPPPAPTAASHQPEEIDLSAEFPGFETAEAPAEAPSQSLVEGPSDLATAAGENIKATEVHDEIDLSEALVSQPAQAEPVGPPSAPAFNFEDSRVEVEFYLDQGFAEEAKKAVEALETKFPGDHRVSELRELVESRTAAAAKSESPVPPVEAALQVASAEITSPTPPVIGPEPTLGVETPVESSTVIANSAAPARPESAVAPEGPPAPAPPKPEPALAASSSVTSPGSDFLGSLAGDLASSLEGIEDKSTASPPPGPAASAQPRAPGPPPLPPPSPLSGILEEFGEAHETAAEDDPQTHYDLGVAFREMSLLDEAIGEFQKVVKGAQKGKLPANFLQACTLLALCFMDKKMPVIAAKWYAKALEIPDLDEEATLALLYDLGVAFEQAGNTSTALEKFSEVYSQNIDYRDVAEKIRILQQKA